MSRVGVYGGSYNPPHSGHVLAAAELVRELKLDRLLIVPAATPPHKTLPAGSPSPEERLSMCEVAFAGISQAEVCDLEIRRPGKSYTVDTLTTLRERYPEDELFLIMGTDMLLSFRTWREPERIARLAKLAVMHRTEDAELWEEVCREADSLRQDMQAEILTVNNRCISVSSTVVRRLLALDAPWCLEPAVEAMIRQNGWYLCGADLKGLPYDRLREVSLELHDEKRRAHVLGTAETAAALALRWGEDEELARRAGILHDITKALGEKEQLHLSEKYAMMLTRSQRKNPKLLHAKTGAEAARRIFGEEEAVVSAIAWHTTGKPAMTTLEKIIYIADYMEPNRSFQGVEVLRELVWKDLDAAVCHGLERSIEHLRKKGRDVDADSQKALDYYRDLTKQNSNLRRGVGPSEAL